MGAQRTGFALAAAAVVVRPLRAAAPTEAPPIAVPLVVPSADADLVPTAVAGVWVSRKPQQPVGALYGAAWAVIPDVSADQTACACGLLVRRVSQALRVRLRVASVFSAARRLGVPEKATLVLAAGPSRASPGWVTADKGDLATKTYVAGQRCVLLARNAAAAGTARGVLPEAIKVASGPGF